MLYPFNGSLMEKKISREMNPFFARELGVLLQQPDGALALLGIDDVKIDHGHHGAFSLA